MTQYYSTCCTEGGRDERVKGWRWGRMAARQWESSCHGSQAVCQRKEEDSCRAWQKQQWVSQAGDIWQTQEAGEGGCWWIQNWHMSPREGGAGMEHTEYLLVRKKNLANWRAPQRVLGHQKPTLLQVFRGEKQCDRGKINRNLNL